MLLVRRLTVTGLFLVSVIAWRSGLGDDAFPYDRDVLKRKVTEIVTPFLLHRTTQPSAAPNLENGEPLDENNEKNKPPQHRAWAIVVGIVTKDDRHEFGFGRFSAESNQRPDARTLFEIGSVTKTFTALLLADLAQRDQLKLNDPVQRHLPESVTVPKHGEKEITLLHLATHTSALPPLPLSISLKALVSSNPYKDYSAQDLYKTLARTELLREPGEQYSYSNFAYGVLGHALTHQAGKSYEELVAERICKPLGLHDTYIQLDEEKRTRLAPPHNVVGKPSSTWEFDVIAPAGALRSTTDDMLTYLEANMGFKQSDLLRAMWRCHLPRRPAAHEIQSIGLGWHVQKMPGVAQLVFHGGGTGGYSSMVAFLEVKAQPLFGIVVLANAGDGKVANDIAIKLLDALHNPRD
jgi:D-alanyl-D-alanine-carboxypeptidase/D-alanyl-D-alanine-endopeptidase